MKKQTKKNTQEDVFVTIPIIRNEVPQGSEEVYSTFVMRLTGLIAQDIADEFAGLLNGIECAYNEELHAKKSSKKSTAKKDAK